MRLYRYLFYRLYVHQSQWNGVHSVPEYTALLLLSIFCWTHVLTLSSLIEAAFGSRIFPPLSATGVVAIAAGILLVHYLALVRGRRLRRIVSEFADRPRSWRGGAVIIAYAVASVVAMVCAARLRAQIVGS